MIRYTIQVVSQAWEKDLLAFPRKELVIILSSEEEIALSQVPELLNRLEVRQDQDGEPITWYVIPVPDEDVPARRIFAPDKEHRVVLSPVLDVPLGIGMRDEVADYSFWALFADDVMVEIAYPALRALCPVAGSMEMGCGYCPGCDLDGPWTCRWNWIQQRLTADGLEDRLAQMYRGDRSYHYEEPVLRARNEKDEGLPQRLICNNKKWLEVLHERAQNRSIAGFDYVSGYYTDRGKTRDMKWKDRWDNYIATTYLTKDMIESRRGEASRKATKAAKTRSQHTEMCGITTDEECLFAPECNLWRWNSSCMRFLTEDHLEAYLAAQAEQHADELLPITLIRRSIMLAEEEFVGINPETGREKDMQFGGWVGQSWWVNMKDGYLWGDHLTFDTWLELKQWVRRWAPWELERFEKIDALLSQIPISDEFQQLYSLATKVTYLRYRSGFGYTSRRISAIRATPKPPAARDWVEDDAEWEPRLRLDMEGSGHAGWADNPLDFVQRYGWRGFARKPTQHDLDEAKYSNLIELLKTPREE